jgi:hypothetical protein
VNEDRRKEELGKVSYETFEVIMDRLEKEWFNLVSMASLAVDPTFIQVFACRRNIFQSKTRSLCPPKTLHVPFAMIQKERIVMQ